MDTAPSPGRDLVCALALGIAAVGGSAEAAVPVILTDPRGAAAWTDALELGDLVPVASAQCPRVEIDALGDRYRVTVCDQTGHVQPPAWVDARGPQARESAVHLAVSLLRPVDALDLGLVAPMEASDPPVEERRDEAQDAVRPHPASRLTAARPAPVQREPAPRVPAPPLHTSRVASAPMPVARPAEVVPSEVPPPDAQELELLALDEVMAEPAPGPEVTGVSAWSVALGSQVVLRPGHQPTAGLRLGAARRVVGAWSLGIAGWGDAPSEITLLDGEQGTWAAGLGLGLAWDPELGDGGAVLHADAGAGAAWVSFWEYGAVVGAGLSPVIEFGLGAGVRRGALRLGPAVHGELGLRPFHMDQAPHFERYPVPLRVTAGFTFSWALP